jgi:hypothetical protein
MPLPPFFLKKRWSPPALRFGGRQKFKRNQCGAVSVTSYLRVIAQENPPYDKSKTLLPDSLKVWMRCIAPS